MILFFLLAINSDYYVTFYSYEGQYNLKGLPNPAESHTFAKFIDKCSGETVEISWCPADKNIWGGPKKGSNLTIKDTITEAKTNNWKIHNHGTYKIPERVFLEAKKQKEYLESGRIKYSLISQSAVSKNCIHAISDITGFKLKTNNLRGYKATEEVIRHFKKTNCIFGERSQKW